MRRILAITLLALAAAVSFSGQTAVSHAYVPALKFKHQVRQRYSSWFVDYVQNNGEPAFRLRVHHYHTWCNGYLFITPTRVAYMPELTPSVNDSFTIERSDIVRTVPRYAGYQISKSDKTYAFAFLSESDEAFVSGESEGRNDLLAFVALTLSDFATAQRQFLSALAGSGADAKGADAEAVTQFSAAPLIRVLSPAGATHNATMEAGAPKQSILGIAAAASGIKAVTVNGTPATLTPLSPQIVQFVSSGLSPKDLGTIPVLVAAAAADSSVTQVTVNIACPGVRITQPAAGGKTTDPAVTIRGLVVGMPHVEHVYLAGKKLPVSKQPDGTFAFESANVPVEIGANYIPGFVARADGEDELFSATVWRTTTEPEPPPPGPPRLTFERIKGALQADVTNSRLISLVDEYGVDFDLTPEMEKFLRSHGANKALIDAISNSQK